MVAVYHKEERKMDLIDNIVSEAVQAEQPVEAVETEVQPSEEVAKEEQAPEAVEAEAPEAEVSENDVDENGFSKKARNAYSHQKAQANKFRHKANELAKEVESLKAKLAQTKEVKPEPKQENYDTYDKFIEDKVEYKTEQKIADYEQNQAKAKLADLEGQLKANEIAERDEYIAQKAQELIKQDPEYISILQNNAELIDSFSDDLTSVLRYMDNAPLAIRNLAKEGRLEAIKSMPINVATVELIQAQYRSNPVSQPVSAPVHTETKISSAPTPIKVSGGGVRATKSVENMSPDEALNWLRKKG